MSLDGDEEGILNEVLPKYLVDTIDESILQDFTNIRRVNAKDRENTNERKSIARGF